MATAKHSPSPRRHAISDRGPLDTVRFTFAWLVTGPEPISIEGHQFPDLPRRSIPVDELRDLLLREECSRQTKDAVWAYVVRRARAEGSTWTTVCAGMALPSLAGSARWIGRRYRGQRVDAHSAVLTGFIEALETIDLDRPGVSWRLHWVARRAGLRALAESLDAPIPIGSGFRSAPPRPPWGHPDFVLVRAVAEEVLTSTEADLIGTTRLDEVDLADWAQTHGVSLGTANVARWRAEQRLVAHLRQELRDTDPHEPVVPGMVTAAAVAQVAHEPAAPPGLSRAVSGRLRNGWSVCEKKSVVAVQGIGPESGLPHHGGSLPTSAMPDRSPSTGEVTRCA